MTILRWLLLSLVAWLGAAAPGPLAGRAPAVAATVTFAAYDVFVDSGNAPLGAWQFEWLAPGGKQVAIVGVEGGDGVFATAPHYDAAALQGGRIVVAAFAAADGGLPLGRARVARVHLRIEGDAPPFAVQLQACADGFGNDLRGAVSWTKTESK